MYDMPYFKEKDQATIIEFIRRHPFATLIGCRGDAPVATQVPLLLRVENDNKLILRGHIMRNSDHHRAFLENPEALCLFSGAHTYVSASWYTDPRQGSTWNYMSVHARGRLRFVDELALRRLLDELTAHFENNPDSPALYSRLPQSYVDSLVKAIVAIEVEVRELENVFKLSQNRDRESYDKIIDQLERQGGDARTIAGEMRKRKAQLFG